MENFKVDLITSECGDWAVLKLNGELFYDGHDIPNYMWIELLGEIGIEAFDAIIPDDDMENGRY